MTSPDIAAPWAPGATRDARLVPLDLPASSTGRLRVAQALDDHTGRAAVAPDGPRRLTITLRRSSAGPARLLASLPAPDAVTLWRPGSHQESVQLPPAWGPAREVGPFNGVCLGALLGRRDRTILTFGATAGDRTVRVRAGMVEETADFVLDIECDLGGDPLTVHLDTTGDGFAASVAAAGRRLGLARPQVTAANEAPTLCTWYSFHQDLDARELDRELRIAGTLGFGTLIVDDGWQTPDTERGYGSCGDWRVEPAKVPDAPALVDRALTLGLRTVWWIGTPFVGYRSRAYREAFLPTIDDEPAMEASVLDPRSPRARRHLVERVAELMRSSGAHGLKLDFLERFATARDAPAPADADHPDATAGGLALLTELARTVEEVRPDAMLEFREPYVSPSTIRTATMIRVADCPLSPSQNRRGIVSMRLATSGVAVHSDPIMWSPSDSPERIAQHLLAALFGVPQVSVRLAEQRDSAVDVLRHWLAFWRRHARVLLHGELAVTGVAAGYTVVRAAGGGRVISVRYADVLVPVPGGEWTEWHLANGGEDGVTLHDDSGGAFDIATHDCRGRPVGRLTGVDLALRTLAVPAGGRALIRRHPAG
ncbi:hypothetical protein [Streptomyces sp. 6N223]|uniref:hypothetical protein n=1 Tax=Streptomyces sp. 6N223 TaxID=3457412 RepID=UPI003FD5707C